MIFLNYNKSKIKRHFKEEQKITLCFLTNKKMQISTNWSLPQKYNLIIIKIQQIKNVLILVFKKKKTLSLLKKSQI